jgi:hypothetical protein
MKQLRNGKMVKGEPLDPVIAATFPIPKTYEQAQVAGNAMEDGQKYGMNLYAAISKEADSQLVPFVGDREKKIRPDSATLARLANDPEELKSTIDGINSKYGKYGITVTPHLTEVPNPDNPQQTIKKLVITKEWDPSSYRNFVNEQMNNQLRLYTTGVAGMNKDKSMNVGGPTAPEAPVAPDVDQAADQVFDPFAQSQAIYQQGQKLLTPEARAKMEAETSQLLRQQGR